MQLFSRLSPKTARKTGFFLFSLSCLTLIAAIALPFVSLPVSGAVKAGLITAMAVLGEVAFAGSLALLGKEYLNKIKSLVSFPTAPFASFFLLAGLSVWAVATLLLRFVGQYLFIPDNIPLTISLFVGVAMLMILLTNTLYRLKNMGSSERLPAATLLAIPGMLLDAGTVFFFEDVFPNMLPEADGLFAAWLFWGYSVVLLTGFIVPGKRNEST